MTDKKKVQKEKAGAKKGPPFDKPRGTRDITDESYYHFQGFFEKAQEVAMYYGFKPIETPVLEQEALFTTSVGEGTDIVEKEMYTLRTKGGDRLALRPEYTASMVRAYIEDGMQALPQPHLLYYYGPVFRHDSPQRGRYRQFYQFGLEAFGSEKSITDALLIKTLVVIFEEIGAKEIIVDINSIGDKESRSHYVKELTAYYRRHISEMPADARERLKTNPLRLLDSKDPKMIAINEDAPESVNCLTPEAKKHFKEVLEYLEEMGIQYRINKSLVRGLNYYSHTVFEILETDVAEGSAPLALAGGGRYNYLGKMLGYKKDLPAVGAAIGVDRIVESEHFKKLSPRNLKKPKVYFIQLGADAKLRSLNVIDILRKAHIPMMQSLSKDSLGAQLSVAEKLEIPYTILFGQKEAIEKSVIVRDMKKHSQETVKLEKLAEYLKSL